MTKKELREKLISISDKKLSEFNKKLCPDTKKEILGIRIPELRKLTKKIVFEEEYIDYLKKSLDTSDKYIEETIIQGLLIGYSKISIEEKLKYMEKLIYKIDSWIITDTVIPTLKVKEKDLDLVWKFIIPYTKSKEEFKIRFAVIVMLDYFINDEYVDKVIETIDKIKTDKYYAQMAMAWTLAEIGIKYNDKAMKYLKAKNNLDKFTYNKTLQKMIESYRVSDNNKKILKEMKIK